MHQGRKRPRSAPCARDSRITTGPGAGPRRRGGSSHWPRRGRASTWEPFDWRKGPGRADAGDRGACCHAGRRAPLRRPEGPPILLIGRAAYEVWRVRARGLARRDVKKKRYPPIWVREDAAGSGAEEGRRHLVRRGGWEREGPRGGVSFGLYLPSGTGETLHLPQHHTCVRRL